ncbi:MAG: hypothetical protein MK188_16440, partial [Gammaproteobacteria bacterium]|nr:hypothetical protein [Gammaproteobacteria bacterium]
MEALIGNDSNINWKTFKTLAEAQELIDQGVLMSWKDAKHVKKVLSDKELESLMTYFAVRMAERVESRLPEEILIESLLILMANCHEEAILNAFLEELVQQPNRMEACVTLVELAITVDVSESEHHEDIFSIAV